MNLEDRISIIENRNLKVEQDKAWEVSWTRRILLTAFTYLAVSVYLQSINVPRPWLNGLVPAAAFVISTFTMPWFKKLWLKVFKK
ncbi:MAG: hypothetical protein ACOZAJ_00405 [Patescibacteria group bacterium]